MMKVIITGGAGFLGSHLVELLVSKNHFPIIIDNLSSGKYKYIKKFVDSKQAKFFNVDINNNKNLKKIPSAKAIIHLAAIASITESINNPKYVNDVNIIGTLNMLEFCKDKKIKKFIFLSSAAIFGDYRKKISESTPTFPTTVYGFTKLMGEHFCRIYSEIFGIKCIVLRAFNIYGPRQNEEYAAVISKFTSRIKKNKPPIIFGNGKQTRDFIYVSDVINAILKALIYNKQKFVIFNLGSGKTTSINQLAKIFIKLSKKKNLKPIHKKEPIGVTCSSTRILKIRKLLGFTPSKRLEDAITELLNNT